MIKNKIKNMIPLNILHNIRIILSNTELEDINIIKNKKKIFICLVPIHGNLGDQAIIYATRKFLEDNFSEYEVIEIECSKTYDYSKSIKKALNKDDLILLHGGGNMGNLYILEEEPRRFIIDKFRNNKIISMPQTITFIDDDNVSVEKNKTIKIYNSNKNLSLIARENKSFKTMKDYFPNNKIFEYPDIVFYLEDMFEETKNRDNILTCLRADKECYFKEKKTGFLKQLRESYDNVINSDTTINKCISPENREVELFKIWSEFRKAKVVITDRLHGMIFSTITKTPCIVLRSLDHKVIESYKWIKDLNYIKFADDLDFNIIDKYIEELSNLNSIDKTNFKEKYFSKMIDDIRRECV